MRNCFRLCTAIVMALLLALLLSVGCSKKEKTGNVSGQDDSPVLATVGDSRITVADFKSYVSDKAPSRPGRVSKEQLKQWLDDRVLEEALYQEAMRAGLDRAPQARQDIRQMLTSRLIDDTLKKEVWSKPISDAEIEQYYNDHWKEFNRPDQVRIADIFIAVPADSGRDEQAAFRAKADVVLKKALEVRKRRFGFGALIREYSDTPEKYRKGDTGFFDERGDPVGIEKALVDAAFSLGRVGDMADHVVEASDGYHVIMLTGKRSGVHVPLDNVRQRLTQRMRREKAQQTKKALIDKIKAESKKTVNEKVLVDLVKDFETKAAKERRASGTSYPRSGGNLNPPALPRTMSNNLSKKEMKP